MFIYSHEVLESIHEGHKVAFYKVLLQSRKDLHYNTYRISSQGYDSVQYSCMNLLCLDMLFKESTKLKLIYIFIFNLQFLVTSTIFIMAINQMEYTDLQYSENLYFKDIIF